MIETYVSICVVSYKSGAFVSETLDSIKNQTYKNIELIISDDGSTDDTVLICREWLSNNSDRFVHSKLLTVEKNTGVTANCNRALAASHGEWWKIIAADDILLPDCIEKCINFVTNNPKVTFLFGNQIKFSGEFSTSSLEKEKVPFRAFLLRDSMTAQKQYKIMSKLPGIGGAPASFIKTEVLRSVGGFNPRFPMNEDSPLYIKLVREGYKLWYMDEYIVYRRVHEQSIMHLREENDLIGKAQVRYIEGEWYQYLAENSNWFWRRMAFFTRWLSMNVIKAGNDKKSKWCCFLNWIRRVFSPYKIYLIWALVADKIMVKLGI